LTDYRDKEAASYTHLKDQRAKVNELQAQVSLVRAERDQAIGEKYSLQEQLRETRQHAAAVDTCRVLEGKLVETKLESANLKMEIENLKDEVESSRGLLVFKNKEFDNLSKELAKVVKQRDLVLERYSSKPSSRNSDSAQTPRKPPLHLTKSAVKPHFSTGVFDIGLSSSRGGSCNSSVVEERSLRGDCSFRGRDLKFE
jgi:chromosome segregation ATPase